MGRKVNTECSAMGLFENIFIIEFSKDVHDFIAIGKLIDFVLGKSCGDSDVPTNKPSRLYHAQSWFIVRLWIDWREGFAFGKYPRNYMTMHFPSWSSPGICYLDLSDKSCVWFDLRSGSERESNPRPLINLSRLPVFIEHDFVSFYSRLQRVSHSRGFGNDSIGLHRAIFSLKAINNDLGSSRYSHDSCQDNHPYVAFLNSVYKRLIAYGSCLMALICMCCGLFLVRFYDGQFDSLLLRRLNGRRRIYAGIGLCGLSIAILYHGISLLWWC